MDLAVGGERILQEFVRCEWWDYTTPVWLWVLPFFRMEINEQKGTSHFNNLTTSAINHIFPQKVQTKLPITQASQRLRRTKSSMGSACADSLHKEVRLGKVVCVGTFNGKNLFWDLRHQPNDSTKFFHFLWLFSAFCICSFVTNGSNDNRKRVE